MSKSFRKDLIEILKNKNISLCRIDVNPDNPANEIYKSWGFKTDKDRMSLNINAL